MDAGTIIKKSIYLDIYNLSQMGKSKSAYYTKYSMVDGRLLCFQQILASLVYLITCSIISSAVGCHRKRVILLIDFVSVMSQVEKTRLLLAMTEALLLLDLVERVFLLTPSCLNSKYIDFLKINKLLL